MDLPIIRATNVTTAPAVPEKIYDRYWINPIRIEGIAGNPNRPLTAIANLCKACILDNGSWELSPTDVPVFIRIDDVIGTATAEAMAGDTDLATIMALILGYLVKKGAAQGVL